MEPKKINKEIKTFIKKKRLKSSEKEPSDSSSSSSSGSESKKAKKSNDSSQSSNIEEERKILSKMIKRRKIHISKLKLEKEKEYERRFLRNKLYLKPNVIFYDSKTKSIRDPFIPGNDLAEFLKKNTINKEDEKDIKKTDVNLEKQNPKNKNKSHK